MKKVLFSATMADGHIKAFHIPYLKWFKEQGFDVHVAARGNGDIPYCDKFFNVSFERSPFKIGNLKAYSQLKKIIDDDDYDIIHCHTPMGGVLTRLAAINARKKGTKVLYTAHGFHFYKGAPLQNWFFYYPVEKHLAKCTDVLITINKEDYEIAKKFKAKKQYYVPGVGVDAKKIGSTIVNRETKRLELGIPLNAIILLSVGELIKRKNHEAVIKACAKLNNPNIYYVICGKGRLEASLRKLCIDLGIENKVIFAGFRRDVFEIMKASDIFVFPSLHEGLPVALMEAMAIGLPVIASKIRGIVDLIEDEVNGYLVNASEISDYAKAVKKVCDNQESATIMRQNCREIIRNFDIMEVIKKMSNVYMEVIEGNING